MSSLHMTEIFGALSFDRPQTQATNEIALHRKAKYQGRNHADGCCCGDLTPKCLIRPNKLCRSLRERHCTTLGKDKCKEEFVPARDKAEYSHSCQPRRDEW